jgi:hypothetical protein
MSKTKKQTQNPEISVWETLYKSGNPARIELIDNPGTPEAILLRILDCSWVHWGCALARRKTLTPAVQVALASPTNAGGEPISATQLGILARRKDLCTEAMLILAKHPDPEYASILVEGDDFYLDQHLPEEVKLALVDNPYGVGFQRFRNYDGIHNSVKEKVRQYAKDLEVASGDLSKAQHFLPLANHTLYEVQTALARNPTLAEKHQVWVWENGGNAAKEALCANENLAPKAQQAIVNQLLHYYNEELYCLTHKLEMREFKGAFRPEACAIHLCRNKALKPGFQLQIITKEMKADYPSSLQREMLHSPILHESVFAELKGHKDYKMFRAFMDGDLLDRYDPAAPKPNKPSNRKNVNHYVWRAMRQDLPADEQWALAKHKSPKVRTTLAGNTYILEEVKRHLSKDENYKVLAALAGAYEEPKTN